MFVELLVGEDPHIYSKGFDKKNHSKMATKTSKEMQKKQFHSIGRVENTDCHRFL